MYKWFIRNKSNFNVDLILCYFNTLETQIPCVGATVNSAVVSSAAAGEICCQCQKPTARLFVNIISSLVLLIEISVPIQI